jgi:hypothetical protein
VRARELTINATGSAFMPRKQRIAIICDVLKPEFAKAGKQLKG